MSGQLEGLFCSTTQRYIPQNLSRSLNLCVCVCVTWLFHVKQSQEEWTRTGIMNLTEKWLWKYKNVIYGWIKSPVFRESMGILALVDPLKMLWSYQGFIEVQCWFNHISTVPYSTCKGVQLIHMSLVTNEYPWLQAESLDCKSTELLSIEQHLCSSIFWEAILSFDQ